MKFFPPELHVRLNSADPVLADAAEAEIDRASQTYNLRWNEIQSRLPASVVQFHANCFLHDAFVLTPAQLSDSLGAWGKGDVVIVAEQDDALLFLSYDAIEPPVVTVPFPSDVFRRSSPHWLYDEFDLLEPGGFRHSILLSDGRELTISFRRFVCHETRILLPATPSEPPELRKAVS